MLLEFYRHPVSLYRLNDYYQLEGRKYLGRMQHDDDNFMGESILWGNIYLKKLKKKFYKLKRYGRLINVKRNHIVVGLEKKSAIIF